ncbi:MAG: hypothetical protein Fur0028_00740 [Bacteroidales bacterium]
MSTIIHVGYPKTGTTWFTDFFYPFIKNANVSYTSDLEYCFDKGKEFLKVKRKIDMNNDKHYIIIAHKFVGVEEFKWDHGKYRDFFVQHLKYNFPDALIIVFIRNQIDFLASVYSSYITHGGTYNFKKLFKEGKLADGSMFAFEYLNYYQLIKLYQEAFGKENVYLYVYEDFMNNNKAFLEKYINDLKIEIDLDKLNYKRNNETLRIGLANIIRLLNYFKKDGVQPKKSFFNIPWTSKWLTKKRVIYLNSLKIFGPKLKKENVLGADLINFMKEYYKSSNLLLINEFSLKNIEKYKYPL